MHTRLRLTLAGLSLTAVACGLRRLGPAPHQPALLHHRPAPPLHHRSEAGLPSLPIATTTPTIYAVNPDGSDLARLTSHSRHDTHPAWSPDGEWIVFQRKISGQYDIFKIRIDGSQ